MLKDDLNYLEIKSIGYNSPTFETLFKTPRNPYKSNIPYWLERIDVCTGKINRVQSEITNFNNFRDSLPEIERFILIAHYYENKPPREIVFDLGITRSKFYDKKDNLRVLYKEYIYSKNNRLK